MRNLPKQHASAGLAIFGTGQAGNQLPADLRVGAPLSHDVEKAIGTDADGLIRRESHGKGVGIEIFGAIAHISAVDVERERGRARLSFHLDQRAAQLAGTVRQGDKLRRVEAERLARLLLPHGPAAPQEARQPEGVAALVPWISGKLDRVQPHVSHASGLNQLCPLSGEVQQLLIAAGRLHRLQARRLPRGGVDQRGASMDPLKHAIDGPVLAADEALKRLVLLRNAPADILVAAQVLHKPAAQHPGQVVCVAVQQVQVGAVPAFQLTQQAIRQAVVFSGRVVIVRMQVLRGNFGIMLLEPGRRLPIVIDQKAKGTRLCQGGRGKGQQQA